MTARNGLFVANGSSGVTSPIEARLALAGLLSSVPGVLRGCNVTGSTSGANMKYIVASGQLATQRGTNITTDGLYLWANDGNYTADSGAPAPTSGTRYDLIYALARNANDGFGDANSDPLFGVAVGVASSSPTKPYPSVPAGAIVLAESLVGTNIGSASAATITQVAAQISSRGGIRPTTDASQYPSSPRVGEYVHDASLGTLMRWNGTAWVPAGLPRAKMSFTTATSIADSNTTTGFGGWDTTLSNGGFNVGCSVVFNGIKVPLAGDYDVTAQVQWATNATGRRGIIVLVNGTEPAPPERNVVGNNGGGVIDPGYAGLLRLAANDKVNVALFQQSGAALNANNGSLTVAMRGGAE